MRAIEITKYEVKREKVTQEVKENSRTEVSTTSFESNKNLVLINKQLM